MSLIHQELQNLKHKLDAKRSEHNEEDHKLMKKIENLKEQFREMLVEMRKRKAAESELAITFNEDDSTVSLVGFLVLCINDWWFLASLMFVLFIFNESINEHTFTFSF